MGEKLQKLAFMITTSVVDHSTKTAYQIVKTTLEQGIEVTGVFFYQSGVTNASKLAKFPSDEVNVSLLWCELADTFGINLHLCSTAAEKYGLLPEDDATNVLHEQFTVSGLGELVVLHEQADKLVQL